MNHSGLFSLDRKCGFVTGSTRSSRKVIALELAQYGATLVQADIDDSEKKHNRSRKWIRYDCLGLYSF